MRVLLCIIGRAEFGIGVCTVDVEYEPLVPQNQQRRNARVLWPHMGPRDDVGAALGCKHQPHLRACPWCMYLLFVCRRSWQHVWQTWALVRSLCHRTPMQHFGTAVDQLTASWLLHASWLPCLWHAAKQSA